MRRKTQAKHKTKNYKKWRNSKKIELRDLKKEIKNKKEVDFDFWNNIGRH